MMNLLSIFSTWQIQFILKISIKSMILYYLKQSFMPTDKKAVLSKIVPRLLETKEMVHKVWFDQLIHHQFLVNLHGCHKCYSPVIHGNKKLWVTMGKDYKCINYKQYHFLKQASRRSSMLIPGM